MKLIYTLWILLLMALPLGSLSRLPLGDIALTVNDIILPIIIGAWLMYVLMYRKEVLLPPRWLFVVGFAFWAFITLVYSLRFLGISSFLVSGLYWFRWVEYAFIFFIGYWLFTQGNVPINRMRQTVKLLLVGQLVFVFAGFLQFILFPNFSDFVQHGWDPHYYRLLSTFLDPNFAGIFIVLGVVFFSALFLLKDSSFVETKSLKNKATAYILFGLIAIVLTFSRSTYLGLMVAVALIGFFASRKVLLIMMFIGIISFLFIPRVQTRIIGALNFDETVTARFDQYNRTLNIIEDNLLFGVGFNTFRYAQEQAGYFRDDRGVMFEGGHAGAGSDSSLLFVLVTTGIPGLLLYLLMWSSFVWDSAKNYFSKGNTNTVRAIGLTVGVSLLSLMAHAQFVNSLFYPWIMAWIWIILALMYAIKQQELGEKI